MQTKLAHNDAHHDFCLHSFVIVPLLSLLLLLFLVHKNVNKYRYTNNLRRHTQQSYYCSMCYAKLMRWQEEKKSIELSENADTSWYYAARINCKEQEKILSETFFLPIFITSGRACVSDRQAKTMPATLGHTIIKKFTLNFHFLIKFFFLKNFNFSFQSLQFNTRLISFVAFYSFFIFLPIWCVL